MASLTSIPWGQLGGKAVELFTLQTDNGVEARITNYGGRIVSLIAPNRDSQPDDVVLGYDTLQEYVDDPFYMGAFVGRFCNRIANASFELNGKVVALSANDGRACLHGGKSGFDRKVMDATMIESPGGDVGSVALELSLTSPDGDEGFPGALSVAVTYTLTALGELRIDYRAVCDRDTVVNPTNHAYFNLAGAGSGDILDHVLEIYADSYLPTDSDWIPTGDVRSVVGTPFDFRTPRAIGERIVASDPGLGEGGGYNHNYVVAMSKSSQPKLIAKVLEPGSGRILETLSTEPGVQFYTMNQMPKPVVGKRGKPHGAYSGFCLETQHFPDSPNQLTFPSTVLRAGDVFRSATIYKFRVAR